jgi:hypothetical protein
MAEEKVDIKNLVPAVQLSYRLNLSVMHTIEKAQSLNIKPIYVWNHSYFTKEDCEKIVANKMAPKEVKRPTLKNIEELRKEHPLVKDDRYLDINFWPDV